MSLRKSPQPTPELLASARSNAQHATGPRSQAGKQNSKMNAVKHGERADPRNHYWVMLALGEDPEEFEYLKKELMLSYGPGEILWQKQIDDLARLYWRRQRLERAQEGVMRRARLGVEERQHRRRLEMAEATFDAAQAPEMETAEPADAGVRLRWQLSFLEAVRQQVEQRAFLPWQASKIESLYQKKKSWRQARLLKLLRLCAAGVGPTAPDREQEESQGRCMNVAVGARHGVPLHESSIGSMTRNDALWNPPHLQGEQDEAREQPDEAQYQELLRLLDEEVGFVQEELEYAEKVNEEKVSIERDACLAPAGEQWQMMLRREAALDRSIDRKVRILLAMRKEFPDPDSLPHGGGMELEPGIAKLLGLDLPTEAPMPPGASPGDVAPLRAAEQGAGSARSPLENRRPWEAGSCNPRQEKVNERTGNVIENKSRGCTSQPTIPVPGHQDGERLSRREGNLPVNGA